MIAEGLAAFGVLRGSVDELVERRTVSLFFPHGVGHMLGLGVRDAGEVLPGREARNDDFPRLRIDLPLLPGHVVTIEPGSTSFRRSSTTRSSARSTATPSTGIVPSA